MHNLAKSLLILAFSFLQLLAQDITYTPSLPAGEFTSGGNVIEMSVELDGTLATFIVRRSDGKPFQQNGEMTIRAGAYYGCVANYDQYRWDYSEGDVDTRRTYNLLNYFTCGQKTWFAAVGPPKDTCQLEPRPEYYSGEFRMVSEQECLEILDLACDPLIKNPLNCLDDLDLVEGSSLLGYKPTQDVNLLAEYGSYCRGVVTDGASFLLLRIPAEETVTFSIVGPDGEVADDCRYGTLVNVGEFFGHCQPREVTPVDTNLGKFSFALYRPPSSFPVESLSEEGFSIKIVAQNFGLYIERELFLHAPPVLIMHGLWDKYSSMKTMESRLDNAGFKVCKSCDLNYGEKQPAGSFSPNPPNTEEAFILNTFVNGVEKAKSVCRADFIACSQVDVVANSMGGLIARASVEFDDYKYRNLSNYGLGYIRRLVTVGTPHNGSPLADWAIENQNKEFFWDTCAKQAGGKTLKEALKSQNKEVGIGVEQLRTDSIVLAKLGGTPFLSHAVVGKAAANTRVEEQYNDLLWCVDWRGPDLDELMGEKDHDTTVTLESQKGGIAEGAYSIVENVVHAAIANHTKSRLPKDVSEMDSVEVFEKVNNALIAPEESSLLSYFPKPDVQKEEKTKSPQVKNKAPMAITMPPEKTYQLRILSHENNEIIPGETIEIEAIPPEDVEFSAVEFVFGRNFAVATEAPYVMRYTFQDFLGGPFEITSTARDINDELYSASLWVELIPNGGFSYIKPIPDEVVANRIGSSYKVSFRAYDSLDNEYFVDSLDGAFAVNQVEEPIILVDEYGVITPLTNGEAIITIQFMEHIVEVPVRVQASNTPPVLSQVDPIVVTTGETINIPIEIQDAENDKLNIQLRYNEISFVRLEQEENSWNLIINPSEGDLGDYELWLSASDEGVPSMGDSVFIDLHVVEAVADEVLIDIKPGNDSNVIHPFSNGKTKVAILSSAEFNAPEVVDASTLTFGRTGDEESLHIRGNGRPNCRSEDVNDDGLLDLVCHFHTRVANFGQGDTEGILRGKTHDDIDFEGRDHITYPCFNFDVFATRIATWPLVNNILGVTSVMTCYDDDETAAKQVPSE